MIKLNSLIIPCKEDKVIMVTNWHDEDSDLLEVVNMPLRQIQRIKADIGVWKIKQLKK